MRSFPHTVTPGPGNAGRAVFRKLLCIVAALLLVLSGSQVDFVGASGGHRLLDHQSGLQAIQPKLVAVRPIRQQKTSDLLIIPLPAEAIDLLGTQATGLVFDLPSRTYILKALKKWAQNAGIDKHIGFHTARHTFAVTSLEMEIDIYTLSKLMGHRTLEQTQVYAKIVDERKQAATAKRNAYWEQKRSKS